MDDPTRELRALYILRVPPGASRLAELAQQVEEWSTTYFAWHRQLVHEVARATLAWQRELVERVAKMEEADTVAVLQASDEPPPSTIERGEDGRRLDADALRASMRKIHDAARTVDEATEVYINVLEQSADAMLGDRSDADDDETAEPRPLRELTNMLGTLLVAFLAEVRRLKDGTTELLGELGEPPANPDNRASDIAELVVVMAGGGHSDSAIARVLGQVFPAWASSAATRARQEAGGASAPGLESKRVQELLSERVRKMRKERGVAAGQAVRAGNVDPLRRLAEFVDRDPDAET